MRFYIIAVAVLSCIEVVAMQQNEEQQIAALVVEIFNDYQHMKNIEKLESSFRAAAMQLFINCEKEGRLKNNSPFKKLCQESSERISDRMVDLCGDISEERQKEILASVPLYFMNQRCFNCNKRRLKEQRDQSAVIAKKYKRV